MTSRFDSFQSGLCQVLRTLGKGGKGINFLSQDTVLAIFQRCAAKRDIEKVLASKQGLKA